MNENAATASPWASYRAVLPACTMSGGYAAITMRGAEWLGNYGKNTFQIAVLAEVVAAVILVTAIWAAGRRVALWVIGSLAGLLAIETVIGSWGAFLWLALPGINAYLLYRFMDDQTPLEDVQRLALGTHASVIHLALLLLIPRP